MRYVLKWARRIEHEGAVQLAPSRKKADLRHEEFGVNVWP
jgi:hypothetical protein